MKEFQSRPDLQALWKHIALPAEPEAVSTPAVSIGTVHGSVLSIVTNQPLPIADLWAKTCAAPSQATGGRTAK